MVGGEEGREMATTINTSPRLAPPPTLSERSSTFPTISSLGQEWKPSWICLAARDTMVFQSSPQFGYIDRAPSTNKSLVSPFGRSRALSPLSHHASNELPKHPTVYRLQFIRSLVNHLPYNRYFIVIFFRKSPTSCNEATFLVCSKRI